MQFRFTACVGLFTPGMQVTGEQHKAYLHSQSYTPFSQAHCRTLVFQSLMKFLSIAQANPVVLCIVLFGLAVELVQE